MKKQTKKEKKTKGTMKGMTVVIRSMNAEGKSQLEIISALAPKYMKKHSCTEAFAKQRIRPHIYRELKKGKAVEKR